MTALAAALLIVVAQTPPGATEDELRDDVPKREVGAPSDEFGRGGSGTVPVAQAQARKRARARVGLGMVGVFGAHLYDYRSDVGGGVGLSAEAGLVLGDRVSVVWRGELASTVIALFGSNGVFVDFAFGEHLAVGFGTTFTLWSQLFPVDANFSRPFQGFTFPLRAHFTFGTRAPGLSRRAGWTLSAYAAPGLSVLLACLQCYTFQGSSFAFTAGAGLGYLWW